MRISKRQGNGSSRLHLRAFSYTLGILCGLYLFSVALFAWSGVNLPFLGRGVVDLVNSVVDGYAPTPGGAFLGLVYGLFWGGIWGWLIAWLYNKLT